MALKMHLCHSQRYAKTISILQVERFIIIMNLILHPFINMQIVEHVRLERSTSYAPIFQLMFVLQERALDSTRSLDDGLEMKQHRLSSGVTAKFDLALELFDEGDAGLLGKYQCCAKKINATSFFLILCFFFLIACFIQVVWNTAPLYSVPKL